MGIASTYTREGFWTQPWDPPTRSLQDNYGVPTAHMTVGRDSLDTDVQMRLRLSLINSEIKRFAKLRHNVLLHDILGF